MNRWVLAAFLALLSSSAAFAAEVSVVESDTAFQTEALTIKQGDAVVFKNVDEASHQTQVVSSDKQVYEKGIESPDETAKFIFARAGNYDVHDAIHPTRTMKVVVLPGAEPVIADGQPSSLAAMTPAAGGNDAGSVIVK